LSLEIDKVAEAEPVISVEGNMCGTVMRGAVAPPGSKTTSRRKGMRRAIDQDAGKLRNLSDPAAVFLTVKLNVEHWRFPDCTAQAHASCSNSSPHRRKRLYGRLEILPS
jgi:hypothetical protein